MASYSRSTELLINMKDIPKWEKGIPYYNQKREVEQFWSEELEKIKNGVNIGGYHIHPQLYFYINYFHAAIPTKDARGDSKDVVMHPPLDDNILYIIDSYKRARSENKGLLLFGTRGFGKTTYISMLTHQTVLTNPVGLFQIVGGNKVDLGHISRALQVSFTNITDAFFLPTLSKDWTESIEFGFKDKSTAGKSYKHSEILITNLEEGKESKSEKGAGTSPIGYIGDEIGKYSFREPFETALPSFRTDEGYKLVPILSGTSGNLDKVEDARKVMEDPSAYGLLSIDFDRLERDVPLDRRTWRNDYNMKFGTFVPGQMSYRLEVKKLKTNLADYLKIKDKELAKIEMRVTDWEKAEKRIDELKKSGIRDTRDKNRMYYPITLKDCFLKTGTNPFPTEAIERTIKALEDDGDIGKNIQILRDGPKFVQAFSDKRRAKVSHDGGVMDAPILLFDDLPQTPPEKYMFVSGLDDYKLNVSGTDSLGSFYVIKRRNMSVNSPCETIAASLTTRPNRHLDFHRQIETMIECWAAECLMESADVSFEDYLEGRHKAHLWLAPAITFAKSKESRNNKNLTKKYGLYPSAGNNEHRLKVLVDWCWEEHVVGVDDDNNEIIKYGVEFIDDIDLLKELRDWEPGKNSDRKEAFSHALLHAVMLDVDNVRPKSFRKSMNVLNTGSDIDWYGSQKPKEKKVKLSGAYGSRRLNPYTIR